MRARSIVQPLAIIILAGCAAAIDLNIDSQDSIKSAAKTLAGSLVTFYDGNVNATSIPGLFPDPYYWWEAGLFINTLVEYYGLTNDSEYNSRISKALQHQLGDGNAFMPANQTTTLGNDDQSYWGLASLSAHEAELPAPTMGSWLQFAKNVFETQAVRWDTASCNGGLRWQIYSFNNGYSYKNAASNGQLFLLAARLADLTGNVTYADWANKVYKWTAEVGLVSTNYHVYDGADVEQNCSDVNRIQWTSNHAEFTEGAALMYKVSNASQNWTDVVNGLVNASLLFHGDESSLVEVACENNGNCDVDQRAFKGIATRSFARAARAAPIIADSISTMLNASARGAAESCESIDDGVACRLSWSSSSNNTLEQDTAVNGNLGEVLNALSAVQALLWLQLGTSNGSVRPNVTADGSPSGASGNVLPTGAGSIPTTSFSCVVAIALAVALVC